MTISRLVPVLLLPLVLGTLSWVRAEDPPSDPFGPESPEDVPPTDWRTLAGAEGLSGAEIERLARDKVLVGAQSFKQVFSPYLGCDLPLFLTSDSVLNAFHVVLEASLVELEEGRAAEMARHLAWLARALPGVPEAAGLDLPPTLVDHAVTRAQITLGVALAGLGAPLDDLPADVREMAIEEAARVVRAEGLAKPGWLGPPDDGFTALDYTRFAPRGFYDRSVTLQRYFRAVSWLQAIPFRVGVDEELLAVLLLAKALEDPPGASNADSQAAWQCRHFLAGNARLWGAPDDAGLTTGSSWSYPFDADDFREKQQWFRELASESLIADQVALGPLGPTLRILPASRLPDAVLFHRTTNEVGNRALPTGLEVAAALGSPVARGALAEAANGQVAQQIERTRPLFQASGLYPEYLRALGRLVGPAEADAPALFSTRPWQVKSCQTLLCAWAQMRRAYVLHAKQSAYYLGLTEQEPGFVEPVPSFFKALREVVIQAEVLLEAGGAFSTARVRDGLAVDLRVVANRLDVLDPSAIGDRDPWNLLSEADERRGMRAFEIVYGCGAFDDVPDAWDGPALQRLITALRTTAATLEDRETPLSEPMQAVLANSTLDLAGTWEALQHLLIDLELLAHKQLRGVAFDERDREFILGYGERLAAVMFYGGNLGLTPRDDAPRIVDVASDPQTGRFLLVGTGRPRALYVLYPWGEEEVLCRGAVLPYHELVDDVRLVDAAWRERLDAAQPEPPAWLRPILAAGVVRPPNDE